MASDLLKGCECGGVIADKAFDTNALRTLIADMGAEDVIPSKRSRTVQIPHNEAAYRKRNRIERSSKLARSMFAPWPNFPV